jgi:hypothetical protein
MRWLVAGVVGVVVLAPWGAGTNAAPVAVQFSEGVTRGFPVLRAVNGERLAVGELTQVARGDRVESRMVFRFEDGSLYDETVVFSQRGVFTLLRYHLVQRGPSFPETIEAAIERASGKYEVRYRADEDSPEELLTGRYDMPPDAYNGMLGILMKNLQAGESTTVQIIAFTPKPRAVKLSLTPAGVEQVQMGDRAVLATRYVVKPQLGLLASLLVTDLAPMHCWIVGGDAPGFVRFQGPLFFMGPVWRIELN